MKQKKKLFPNVKGMTVAAMLVAMSVIIGIFCKNYLNFGAGLYRITFENLPILMAGMMFGPIVGCMVGVASDLVSYLFSNQIYPPNLLVTVGAGLIGACAGTVSHYLVKKSGCLQIVASGVIAHVIGSMIVKSIGLYQYYGILILWRIPLYVGIATVEILILCMLYRRKNFLRVLHDIQ
ncbi:MAG: folate family ECF transporter S component [Clostridia bacterium]|nr:folate family ECF transporter S component [Clostridia bacterium]